MKSRVLPVLAVILVTLALVAGACSAGFVVGQVSAQGWDMALELPNLPGLKLTPHGADDLTDGAAQNSGTPADLEKLFQPFWQAWKLVHKSYVAQPVDDTTLMRGAISGMLDALGDEHTSYLAPSDFESLNAELGQEYEGIGAWVDTSGEYLSIIAPIPGSPAEAAGLKAGDQVTAVDGEDMTGIDGELVRQRIIGPKGSQVTLTIRRQGVEKPFDVTVTRAAISIPSVESKMLDDQIGYVRLLTFGEQTENDLRKALKDILAQNPKGLILDLRNNGGGYLNTGIAVVSEFIGDGVVMYEEYGDGHKQTYYAKGKGLATDIPLVVLVNEGTASASEIVAGAVQDRGRGKLVGVKTYGKGSVQTITPLVDDQGAARITIARWLTPNERQINKVGLTPDVEVEISEADSAASKDPQLDKAIELLK